METKKHGTKVILYFEKMKGTQTCFNIGAIQYAKVEALAASEISIYDYYESGEA